jgi:hypothetical protein
MGLIQRQTNMFQAVPKTELFIVDDDVTTRDTLAARFTLAGFRVRGFADAETFLIAARANYMLNSSGAGAMVSRVGVAIMGFTKRTAPRQRHSRRGVRVSRTSLADGARTRDAGADLGRCLAQRVRPPARHQPAYHRGPSRPHHGKGWRPECRRFCAHRARRGQLIYSSTSATARNGDLIG